MDGTERLVLSSFIPPLYLNVILLMATPTTAATSLTCCMYMPMLQMNSVGPTRHSIHGPHREFAENDADEPLPEATQKRPETKERRSRPFPAQIHSVFPSPPGT